jgi:hypothetical protein
MNIRNELSTSLPGLSRQSLKSHCKVPSAAAIAGTSPAMTVEGRSAGG